MELADLRRLVADDRLDQAIEDLTKLANDEGQDAVVIRNMILATREQEDELT